MRPNRKMTPAADGLEPKFLLSLPPDPINWVQEGAKQFPMVGSPAYGSVFSPPPSNGTPGVGNSGDAAALGNVTPPFSSTWFLPSSNLPSTPADIP